MKKKIYFLTILILSILYVSCQSTKVYTEYEETIYTENRVLSKKIKKADKEEPVKEICDFRNENENLCRNYTEKKITVISNTDFKFMAYSFFLKPFIILGSSIFSLGKCICISTSFFVFAAIDLEEWPSFFDCSHDKQKMINASYENRIQYYPEYHKPFTRNHIITEKTDSETTSYKTKNEKTVIIDYQKYEYDNTIYVRREINKDFYSTIYVVKHIGNVITFPIALTTTIAGVLVNKAFIK